MHTVIPLTEIVTIVLCALVCGMILTRLKQPAVLGYVLAGVILGPSLLEGADIQTIIKALAELGVFMLLFTLGVDMNLRFFKSNWVITVGCVLLQFLFSIAAVYGISVFFNWSFGLVFVIGSMICLSSTAVAIKMLESMGELKTDIGHLTISILIAQDLAFVPMALAVHGLGDMGFSIGTLLAKICISVGILVALIWYLSRTERVRIPYLNQISHSGELLPLMTLSFCFGLAAITGALGLSASYGAFLAGLVLGNTAERHEIIKTTHPIQSTLLMVFFLSIGLLIDLKFIWSNITLISILMVVIAVGKTALNAGILHMFKQKWTVSFISSLVLAQIGEFSFVLADSGVSSHLLGPNEHKLVISLTVLSLIFSPFWMSIARKFQGLEKINSVYQASLNTPKGIKNKIADFFSWKKDDL
ncbi:MAG: cation:proton antiporter [Alphaproteobacteria bacterium]